MTKPAKCPEERLRIRLVRQAIASLTRHLIREGFEIVEGFANPILQFAQIRNRIGYRIAKRLQLLCKQSCRFCGRFKHKIVACAGTSIEETISPIAQPMAISITRSAA